MLSEGFPSERLAESWGLDMASVRPDKVSSFARSGKGVVARERDMMLLPVKMERELLSSRLDKVLLVLAIFLGMRRRGMFSPRKLKANCPGDFQVFEW